MTSVIFFGTSEFAIPVLEKLKNSSGFTIVAIITQPDKPAGRKQEFIPSPVKVWAMKNGIEVLQPRKLDPLSFLPLMRGRLRGGRVDFFIVASYGKIIPKEILDIPKYGALNIHPSLLPKYRGASPIQATILNGDKGTGVTIIKMDEEMDHGDVVAVKRVAIGDQRLGFKDLHDQLAAVGAGLLMETLPKYIAGEIKPKPQDHAEATFTKIITKDDARIDWSKSAEKIERMVRAYEQWPVAWTTLDGKRLKVYSAFPSPHAGEGARRANEGKPGEVAVVEDKILVGTTNGSLELLELQLEGGKKMAAPEFLRGHKDLSGKKLI